MDDSKTLVSVLTGIALTLAAPVLTFFSLVIWLSGMPWTALVTFASGLLGFVAGLALVARACRN